jgi:hypothetical protein
MECLATFSDNLTKKYNNHNDAYVEGATKLSWKDHQWRFIWPSFKLKFPGPYREEVVFTFLKKTKEEKWTDELENKLNNMSNEYRDTENSKAVFWIRIDPNFKFFHINNNPNILEVLTNDSFREKYIDYNYLNRKLIQNV